MKAEEPTKEGLADFESKLKADLVNLFLNKHEVTRWKNFGDKADAIISIVRNHTANLTEIIDQQKAEIEKQSELLKEAYDVIMMLRPTNAGLGRIAYRLKNYKNFHSYKDELTEANQRGEKLKEALKEALLHIISKDKTGEYYIQLNHDIRVVAKQALSEYNSTKVK